MQTPEQVIFGGSSWPIGWGAGFIERPFSDVFAVMREWQSAPDEPRYRYRELTGVPLAEQLTRLAPLQQPPKRKLMVATQGGWTAYFDNSILGGDPFSWVGHLSRHFGCQGVIAVHIPRGQYPFPATQFQLFGPTGEEPLHYVRTVSAGIFDEGRWRFDTSGQEQPFEESDAYSSRLVRDRLTREMLVRYLSALGIDADNPAFYGDGVLVESRARWRSRTLTLDEARRDYSSAKS